MRLLGKAFKGTYAKRYCSRPVLKVRHPSRNCRCWHPPFHFEGKESIVREGNIANVQAWIVSERLAGYIKDACRVQVAPVTRHAFTVCTYLLILNHTTQRLWRWKTHLEAIFLDSVWRLLWSKHLVYYSRFQMFPTFLSCEDAVWDVFSAAVEWMVNLIPTLKGLGSMSRFVIRPSRLRDNKIQHGVSQYLHWKNV
jgi:hypothetical protein